MLDIMLVTLEELQAVRQTATDLKNEQARLEFEWADIRKVGAHGRSVQWGAYKDMNIYRSTGKHPVPHIQAKIDRIAEIPALVAQSEAMEKSMIDTHNLQEREKVEMILQGELTKEKRVRTKAKHRGGHPESTGTIKPTSRRTKHGTVKRRRPIMQRRR